MKLCDLTQFYSPVSGGVKRYVHEKIRYIQRATDDQHVLVIPGNSNGLVETERSSIYSIRSPLLSRTSRYRILLNLRAIEEILERERPDLIESGDPYQVAWKAIASGMALRIPVVGFYHSHFPEAYLRTTARFFGRTATEFMMDLARRYVRQIYNRFEATLVPSEPLGTLLGSWGVKNVCAAAVTRLRLRTCSKSSSRPSGLSTRAISARVAGRSVTEQSTSAASAVSNECASKGSCSAVA